ncbi:hypothetical protein TRVA0_010S01068 [Trichomonascus vanleenenianus]|uniref:N-acetylglucosaminyldiphosphodolichol N-acetylglucosaminyltransferase anchoring subunit ALG14 n=1 Tax=Trichomonascus vanleenenianus TaxID=2268995 RepID=UPI003EC97858
MLRLLEPLKFTKYSSRTWVYSSGDDISAKRAVEFERKQHGGPATSYEIKSVTRARSVGQPWSSTWVTALKSLSECISLARTAPDVLVCNGPGTSVPLCLATFILRFIGIIDTRIVFVESLARVHNLSLSGMILLPIADRFIVQWPTVAAKYRRAEYYGLLV